MPPAYVTPYVKRGKTDAADAEAICEAVARATMRFVAVKSEGQQAILMLNKTGDLLVRQRTGLINVLRCHLAEYGIVTGQGPGGVKALVALLQQSDDALPTQARVALQTIVTQLQTIAAQIEGLEAEVLAWHRTNETSRRLATIPCIGPITATALAAAVPDATLFRSGRQFAALAGVDAKAKQLKRQGAPRGHQQTGRRLSATLARRRGHGRREDGPPKCSASTLVGAPFGAEDSESRDGRHGQ